MIPPTGSTNPHKLISPVIAVSLQIVRLVISDVSAMNIAALSIVKNGFSVASKYQ